MEDISIDMEILIQVEASIFLFYLSQWFVYFPSLTGNINLITHLLALEKSELVMQHTGIKWHPHS